ncbi:hypothetical protein [Solibacillus isronensis]|uniref:hypothetical protein n=1 Tax=Solibacillus isronensis TaxID=412383 RepID=UPI0039A14A1B
MNFNINIQIFLVECYSIKWPYNKKRYLLIEESRPIAEDDFYQSSRFSLRIQGILATKFNCNTGDGNPSSPQQGIRKALLVSNPPLEYFLSERAKEDAVNKLEMFINE